MKKGFGILILLTLLLGCSKNGDSPVPVKPDTTSQQNNDPSTTGESSNQGDSNDSGQTVDDLTNQFTEFMESYGIPGAQIAITRNEKLVYLQSFGLADVANGDKVSNSSRFRVASISKPITVLAISKLIASNQLSRNDKVFGENGILGNDYGTPPYDPLITTITVEDLIEHKGGFVNEPYDIMFDDPTLTHADLIAKVLDERTLSIIPGSEYQYSNFGYSLLGRIIEKVSGTSYENYVQEQLLSLMDIGDMSIAGNTEDEARANEVTYYSSWASPYEMNVNRMDSHGGWIANAKDLAFFAVQVDYQNQIPDILEMGEGIGILKNGNWRHYGALPGTLGILNVGYPFSYVVLVNTGDADFNEVLEAMNSFMIQNINEINEWPSQDLFNFL